MEVAGLRRTAGHIPSSASPTSRCRAGRRVTLRHRGRVVRVRVIDRGPYVGAREYDLTAATAQRLKFKGHGTILSTR